MNSNDLKMSVKSSPPPGKPNDCPSDIWSSLSHIVDDIGDEEAEKRDLMLNEKESYSEPTGKEDKSSRFEESQKLGSVIEKEIILEIIDLSNLNNLGNTIEGSSIEMSMDHEIVQEEATDINKNTGDIKNNIKKITRKRKRNLQDWKQNVRKEKRQHGLEYIDTKGRIKPQRRFVENFSCKSEKCGFNCTTKITQEERSIINEKFWSLADEKKNHFYSKHVKRNLAVRKRTQNENSRRKYSYKYFLYVRGVKIRVCQIFFFNTLNISKTRIYYFFKNVQDTETNIPRSPLTGKHKKKVISEEMKKIVRSHIESFPVIESHYYRKNSTKKYLERGLSIQRMYDLYKSREDTPVKFHMYKKNFTTEYNLSFFKPKKNLCDKCEGFKMNKNPTEEEIFAQNEHITRKNIGNEERNRDRQAYVDDNQVGILTFDLQNTFSLPKSNVSNFYYKSKLCCYNLTAHFDKTKVVYNAIWHEMLCGRSGVHIACAIYKILKSVIQDNPLITKLILWSDSCVPQNKNSIMSCSLQHFLNSPESGNLKSIEQKFSEPGHGNVQEIDSAHSCIERYLKNLDIWSPLTLIRLLLKIPHSWKLKFKVLQMTTADYKNFQAKAETLTYNKIPFTKVKHIIYNNECTLNIKFREAFEGNFTEIKLHHNLKKVRNQDSRIICVFPVNIPAMNLIPKISDLKRKHLTEMLPYLPEEERLFYNAILTTNTKNDKSNKDEKIIGNKKKIGRGTISKGKENKTSIKKRGKRCQSKKRNHSNLK